MVCVEGRGVGDRTERVPERVDAVLAVSSDIWHVFHQRNDYTEHGEECSDGLSSRWVGIGFGF